MTDILLTPPVAFLIFLAGAAVLSGAGRLLAGPAQSTALKSSTYTGGEDPPQQAAVPGYRPFFVVALFFAVLHLGVLVLATGGLTPIAGVYLIGLGLAMLALILG